MTLSSSCRSVSHRPVSRVISSRRRAPETGMGGFKCKSVMNATDWKLCCKSPALTTLRLRIGIIRGSRPAFTRRRPGRRCEQPRSPTLSGRGSSMSTPKSTPKSTPDRHFGWQRGCKANRAGTILIRSRGMFTVSRALDPRQL